MYKVTPSRSTYLMFYGYSAQYQNIILYNQFVFGFHWFILKYWTQEGKQRMRLTTFSNVSKKPSWHFLTLASEENIRSPAISFWLVIRNLEKGCFQNSKLPTKLGRLAKPQVLGIFGKLRVRGILQSSIFWHFANKNLCFGQLKCFQNEGCGVDAPAASLKWHGDPAKWISTLSPS